MRGISLPVFYDEASAASTQYSSILSGMRAAAAHNGTRVDLISQEKAAGLDVSALAPVAVIACASMPYIRQMISLLRAHGRRTVLAGMDSEQFDDDVSYATPSRRIETQQLVNYLYQCGKERLALVGFGKNSVNDTFRYHAAMSAVALWGRILKEDVWLWVNDPCESFEAFLDAAAANDAVICPNDIMAICLISGCRARGSRVPEDLYVASFGNTAVGGFFRPSITSMTMDMAYVGEQAYHVWRFLLTTAGPLNTSLKITVPSRILARESTGCRSIEPEAAKAFPILGEDRFYHNPTIAVLIGLDQCISQRDKVDMQIIRGVMDGKNYEQLCEEVFVSSSTLRYRLHKIFTDAGVRNRQEFERLIHTHLGAGNPFSGV